MERKVIVMTLLITSFLLGGCKNNPKKEEVDPHSFTTMKERLKHLDRVEKVTNLSAGKHFGNVYQIDFKQYIDHNNKDLGTFTQTVEIGFNGFDKANVYVSSGYMISSNNSYYA